MKTIGVKKVKSALLFGGLWISMVLAQPAKLAIVIDDIGYHQKEDAQIYALPKEISVAIIPSAPYARQRNEQAYQQGRDILIHMPMQPLSHQRIEVGGLHVGMRQEDVQQRVQTAKAIVSHAIGMNNHMGSAATADAELMRKLMQELKVQDLFFLDSRTIGRSVAGKIAKEYGVQSLDRHIFLDDKDTYTDVERQFQRAVHYAQKHGTAIAIGHPRKNTVAVLQAGLKHLPDNVQLVGMGSLWRSETGTVLKPLISLFNTIPAATSSMPYQAIPMLRGIPQ
ncbi:divergent polysaccharide deacetylase family protein [Pasteurella multocida]|uniref:divergent polysaccharide deacetylase family protein n=1 Tax=Pasteurella multocida TaxID=747 RepID=UPI002BD41600|nr:divergent polysaccharide deacetylase family protein [Pasteurella multocida]MEB3483001.1 divergent polysaccharide deacetylase family protein [Pasteurella multocida]